MKPDNVTFAQVASVPVAAFTALQRFRDKGRIQLGYRIRANKPARPFDFILERLR